MVIVQVIFHDPVEMFFIKNDNPVKAFPPYRADHSFAIRILPRRSWGGSNFIHSHDFDHVLKRFAIDVIPIAEEEARLAAVTGKRLDDLPLCPLGRWIWCDVEVGDTPSIMANDYEAE